LLALRETAFTDPQSYFHEFATQFDREQTAAFARDIWRDINEVNLVTNILPTRARATLVLRKGKDHDVQRVRLRRI
jgi:type I pantothenate kinase